MTDLLPLTPADENSEPMQIEKPIIQRNILALKEMIETTTNPEAKVALKLRLVEWASKLQNGYTS